MNHAWSAQMVHLARDLGVHGYEAGTLWFREQGGAEVVVEPLLNGESLAVHTRMGRVGWEDMGPNLEELLQANAPSESRCIMAIDAVEDDVILFRRFDDASVTYQAFVDDVHHFAQTAAEGLPALATRQRNRLADGVEPMVHIQADHVVRNAIGDFALARGLVLPEDTSHFLVCMPDGGGIGVQIEPSSGDVLLISHLGPAPTGDPALRLLLELHMLGEATGGAYFAFDERGGDLILHRRVNADGLDGLELDRLLNALGAATVDCAQRLGISLPRFG